MIHVRGTAYLALACIKHACPATGKSGLMLQGNIETMQCMFSSCAMQRLLYTDGICESVHPHSQITGPYTWQKAYQPDGMGSYDLTVFQVPGVTLT